MWNRGLKHCDDEKKSDVIERIVDFGDGAWAAIRQSNTSPKISICMEARSKEKLQEVAKNVREHLSGYREITQ